MKQNNKAAIIISAIMLVFVVIVIFFSMQGRKHLGQEPEYMETKTLKTQLVGSDGGIHTLDARFIVDVEPGTAAKIDMKALEERMESIVKELDYDKLTAYNGTLYVKEKIREGISDLFPEGKINGVYIRDIASDFNLPQNEKRTTRDEIFRALFPNMK